MHIFCRHLPFLQDKSVVTHCNLTFLTCPILIEASAISEAFSVEILGLIPETCAHHYGRDLEHFPRLWAHRQGTQHFSHALREFCLCKLLLSLNPCLPSRSPSAHPGHIAPQSHFSLPQLFLARLELQKPLSGELLAAGRSSLPALGVPGTRNPLYPLIYSLPCVLPLPPLHASLTSLNIQEQIIYTFLQYYIIERWRILMQKLIMCILIQPATKTIISKAEALCLTADKLQPEVLNQLKSTQVQSKFEFNQLKTVPLRKAGFLPGHYKPSSSPQFESMYQLLQIGRLLQDYRQQTCFHRNCIFWQSTRVLCKWWDNHITLFKYT